MCNIVRSVASVVIAYAALVQSPALARPTFLHETERVPIPAPYFGASRVCLENDHLLVLAERNIDEETNAHTLLHFRRESDGWQFIREVVTDSYAFMGDIWSHADLTCDGPLAAMSTPIGSSFVVELIGSAWQATRVTGSASHTAVSGNTAAFGTRAREPVTIELASKNAAGTWSLDYAVGVPGDSSFDEYSGPGKFVLTANAIAVEGGGYVPHDPPDGLEDELVYDDQIFDRTPSGWRLTRYPDHLDVAAIGDEVALLKDKWATAGEPAAYYTRNSGGAWTIKHSLLSAESGDVYEARFVGDRAYAPIGAENEIAVFVRESTGLYRHRATLNLARPSSSSFELQPEFNVDKDRIAALGGDSKTVYVFRVPTTLTAPLRTQQTFEGANVADWQPWGKTDWRLSTTGGSRVFRQSNTEGDARAILQTFAGTDQAIQADVRILSLAGSTPWAGFMLRYKDPQNFYYLLINATSVQIRKMANGVFGPLTRVPFTLRVGHPHQVRFEAIGTRLRAFVNGELMAEAIDATHSSGRVGLTMYHAKTEYDNVVLTVTPQRDLLRDPFSWTCCEYGSPWATTPASQWSIQRNVGAGSFRQSSPVGLARAVNGGSTEDQVIRALVLPQSFNASGRGFIGVMARHVDASNYYYGVLTADNRVSLRKVVNGVVTVLDESPLSVAAGAGYTIRLEAIGSWIRMYVGGWLMAEAQDSALRKGNYGLITNDAAATFKHFSSMRP